VRVEIHVLEEAVIEAQQALEHLEAARAGLGAAFERALAQAFRHLQQFPESGASAEFANATRRWKLARFPYSIIYVTGGDRLVVIAIANERRRPGYWSLRGN
jgi:plasmid stabilization system protein ParE